MIVVEWVTQLPRIFGFQRSNLGPEISLCIFFSKSTKSTKCQDSITASGAGDITNSKLIPKVGRVGEFVCA